MRTKNKPAFQPKAGWRRMRAGLALAALCGMPAGFSWAAEETRTTAYVYDSQGQLLREIAEPTDTRLCVASVYTYDDYGNRRTVEQRNCNGTAIPGVGSEAPAPAATDLAKFTLGKTTRLVDYPGAAGATQRKITTANALYTQGEEVVDPRFGTPASVKDANGLITRYRYDALGRKTLEQHPDGNGTRWMYQLCGGAVACASVPNVGFEVAPAYVITSYPVKNANVDTDAGDKDGPHTKTYHDVLDREIRVEREGWDGDGTARLVYEDTCYNGRGRLLRKSAPYYAGAQIAWAYFSFDVRGRMVYRSEPQYGVSAAAGAAAYTTWSYAGLTTTRTVQAVAAATPHSTQTAQTTIETRNAMGQLVAVTDTEGRTQTRSYTPWGDLQATVDPMGNTVRMEYDRLGRKTRMVDPDLGTWTYEHDALGRLVKQTDAKGQAIANGSTTLEYDLLGRLKRRLEPDQDSRWFYDNVYGDGGACANALGRLCEAATFDGNGQIDFRRWHAYDSLGRTTRTVTRAAVLNGTRDYQIDVTYNLRGQVETQTYPGPAAERLSLTHQYTPLGFLKAVARTGTGPVYWTGNQYDALGSPTLQTYGNGVATTRSYDPVGRLLTSAAGSGNAVQNDSYGYDLQGNLRVRSETRAGAILTHQYDYDNLNRLKTETRGGGALAAAQTLTWGYDAIGNLTSRSDVGTFTYPAAGSARPHAVSSVNGTVNGVANPAYTYDANGNILTSAGRSATWKSFNLPATLARGANQLAWAYDGDHERVREDFSVNGVVARTTVYVNPAAGAGLYYEEELVGSVVKRRHYINGSHGTVAVLTRTGTTDELRYWHKDHLGSTQVVTDAAGTVVERLAYEPFGKRRGADNATDAAGTLAGATTDRGFTGHEMLDEVGLVHMNGRIYDPAIGRFLSPDPYVPDPGDLQSFNRYSYVRNNPLSLVDPSGFNEDYCDCSTYEPRPSPPIDAPSTCVGCGASPTVPGMDQVPWGDDVLTSPHGDRGWNPTNGSYNCAVDCTLDPVAITGTGQGALSSAADTVAGWFAPPDLSGYSDRELYAMMGWSGAARVEYVNRAAARGHAISAGAVLRDFYKETAKGVALSLLATSMLTATVVEKGTVAAGYGLAANAAKGVGEASSVANAARLRGQLAGQEIAGGHAFEKHVLNQGEFKGLGIRTREQFANHIENVVNNPTASRQLSGGRSAYWQESTGTVVIRNPRAADGGTAFQPTNGRAYFDGLR